MDKKRKVQQSPKLQKKQKITQSQDAIESDYEDSIQGTSHSLQNNNESIDLESLEGHKPGSVVRVKLHNFVTYDDVEFFPGPRLNVVIGPNGTGKSTIVCALALGLAGSTSILGRAKDIGDFVKHGCEKGYVEIELKGTRDNNNVTIRRDLRRDNTSEWKINAKSVNKTKVKELVDSWNIQVDNLCQFLPQDKVVNFAGLSSQQLLRETEKAVGSVKMLERHDKLIQLRKDQKGLQLTTREHVQHLDDLKERQKSVERDYLRFQERQRLLKLVEDLEKKKKWLEFEEQRLEAQKLKATRDELDKKCKAFHKDKLQPIETELKKAEEKGREIDSQKMQMQNTNVSLDKERRGIGENIENIEAQEEKIRRELQNLNDRAEDRKKEYDHLVKDVHAMKQELDSLPSAHELSAQLTTLSNQFKEKQNQVSKNQKNQLEIRDKLKDAQFRQTTVLKKLRELDDAKKRKLETLKYLDSDASSVYEWVQQMNQQGSFKKPVLGPLFMEVNVANPQYAVYMEGIIANWLLSVRWHVTFIHPKAYVTQTPEDRELLTQEFRQRKVKVPVTNYVPGHKRKDTKLNLSEIPKYGFVGYLDELFEAPATIKAVLNDNSNLDTILVGSNQTTKFVQEIIDTIEVRYFFTPENGYSKVRSQYGRKLVSTRVDKLREQPRVFTSVDMKQKARLDQELKEINLVIDQLNEEYSQYSQADQGIQQELASIKNEKDERSTMLTKRNQLEKKIATKESQLESLQQEEDTTEERQKLERNIASHQLKRVTLVHQMKDLIKKMCENALELDFILLQRLEMTQEIVALRARLDEAEQEIKTLQRSLADVTSRYESTVARAKELKRRAEQEAPLDDEFKAIMPTLPDTIDEIENAILENTAKADANYNTNPSVIEQYEKRRKEIEELQGKLNNENTNLDSLQAEIDQLKKDWLEPLGEIVQRISASFSKFFSQIGCAGEVALKPHEDFDEYAIQILVKFRDEDEMAPLDPHRQSGGERSVATMLYLISLQEITPCPFRLVDEINQGMDPINERMIFKVVADCACKPGVPQYFLVTPKLLPDLEFSEKMTVLCIFNGPWQVAQKDWKVEKFLPLQ